MSTIARVLEWLTGRSGVAVYQAMPGRNCAESTGSTGKIEVFETSTPASRRLCVLGGQMHCRHGADHCCWCEIRAARTN